MKIINYFDSDCRKTYENINLLLSIKQNDMILDTISSLELKAIYEIREKEKRVNSILKIKQYLSKIDFEMEDVPLIDELKFRSLMESLKGEKLDNGEEEILKEIMNNSDSNKVEK